MKLNVKIWKDHRGLYRASCDSLPGCEAVGATEVEVQQKMRTAVAGYVASFHAVRPLEVEEELVESGY